MGKVCCFLCNGFSQAKIFFSVSQARAYRVGDAITHAHFLVSESAYNSPLARGCTPKCSLHNIICSQCLALIFEGLRLTPVKPADRTVRPR